MLIRTLAVAIGKDVRTEQVFLILLKFLAFECIFRSGSCFGGTASNTCYLPLPRSVEESYITSEHCYQKPRAYYPAVEQKLVVETRGSALDDAVNPLRENGDDSLSPRLGWPLDQDRSRGASDSKSSSLKVCGSLVLVLNLVFECLSPPCRVLWKTL